MFCFEYTGSGWQHHQSVEWGQCRRLVEVHDDMLASRQVEFYKNGRVLKYDRNHSRDAYGHLIGLRFSKKDKWRKTFDNVELMSAADFDRVWREAETIL